MKGHREASRGAQNTSLISLKGEFVAKHREQLRQLARMTARAAALESGNGKILCMNDFAEEIRIETDSPALAKRIGERISAVCGGNVIDSQSEIGVRLCLVWSRMGEP